MMYPLVNIHTHRPTGRGIELRTAGIHPWDAAGAHAVQLLPLAPTVQAIGEIGLDSARGPAQSEQLRVLREQLDLAQASRLPVVLHCVRAFEPLMNELRRYRLRGVIFHGFIGSPQQALQALGRGYYLSFGERTFRSPRTCEALRLTSADRLFCETDESQTPIDDIYARIAQERGTDVPELAEAVWRNYLRIFKHDDR